MERKIVLRVEDNMNREDLYATTYQMRDFFKQMKDGFFSELDVMNYIQHYKIAKMCGKDDLVLDMCCGRNLMLPLLRYHAKDIKGYHGIDIKESNIKNGYHDKLNYPFPITMHYGSVEEMSSIIKDTLFDFIIYTSSIEHMQKECGEQSLREMYKLLKPDGIVFFSCPNTIKDNPYDSQYRAHIYEWNIGDLRTILPSMGFKILKEFGIVIKKRKLTALINEGKIDPAIVHTIKILESYLPREFFLPTVALLVPDHCDEVAMILHKI